MNAIQDQGWWLGYVVLATLRHCGFAYLKLRMSPNRALGHLQVVEHATDLVIGDAVDGLGIDDHRAVGYQVRDERANVLPFVVDPETGLLCKGYPTQPCQVVKWRGFSNVLADCTPTLEKTGIIPTSKHWHRRRRTRRTMHKDSVVGRERRKDRRHMFRRIGKGGRNELVTDRVPSDRPGRFEERAGTHPYAARLGFG